MMALLYGSETGWTDLSKVEGFWRSSIFPQLLGCQQVNQLV